MKRTIKRYPVHILSGAILLVLIALAVPLVLSSADEVGQLRKAKERLSREERAFATDFDREITRAVIYFAIAPSADDAKLMDQIARRWVHWHSNSPHPQLIRGLFFQRAESLRRGELLELDPVGGRLGPATWPERFDPLVPVEPDSPRPQEQGTAFRDDIPALVLPISQGTDLSDATESKAEMSPQGHIIIDLDLDYITDEFIPGLVERHFSAIDGVAYNTAVIRRTHPDSFVFRSAENLSLDDFSPPDVEGYIFDLLTRRHYRDFLLDVGLSLGMLYPDSEEAQAEFAAAQVPRSVVSEGESVYGQWQVLVRHPAGSLALAFEQKRWKRAALNVALFGLLGATAILLIVSTLRAQRLANQQIEFVAGVSHELRSPLSVIRLAARNLEHGTVTERESIHKYAALIGSEERRLSSMVERVLAFGQMQRGEKAFVKEPVRVNDVVELAITDCAAAIEENQADVEPHYSDEELFVSGDGEALRQAFQNLVANAIKHSGNRPHVNISVGRSRRTKDEVLVAVGDQGPGIPSLEIPHIFEPFFRGEGPTAEQVQGSGLGLSLVRKIVDAHRGRIDVKSGGSGSIFVVHLPMLVTSQG